MANLSEKQPPRSHSCKSHISLKRQANRICSSHAGIGSHIYRTYIDFPIYTFEKKAKKLSPLFQLVAIIPFVSEKPGERSPEPLLYILLAI
jgi:hypothetical protein